MDPKEVEALECIRKAENCIQKKDFSIARNLLIHAQGIYPSRKAKDILRLVNDLVASQLKEETYLKEPIPSLDTALDTECKDAICTCFFHNALGLEKAHYSYMDITPELKLQLLSGKPDDYQLALKHEVGDFDPIPMSLQKEIRDFAKTEFWPAVLEYLGNIFPKYRAYSICQVELRGLNLWNYKGRITGEMAYDLHNVEHILSMLPTIGYAKIGGKRDIGSVIRICKAINKQNLADNIYQIVEKCFTPYNHQDPKDSSRFNFGLYVEPSTGGIQCDCCKGK